MLFVDDNVMRSSQSGYPIMIVVPVVILVVAVIIVVVVIVFLRRSRCRLVKTERGCSQRGDEFLKDF